MKIAVLVVGILGIILGLVIAGVSLALPELTSNRVDFGEALIGIIAGVLVLVVSFVIALVGLILVLKSKK